MEARVPNVGRASDSGPWFFVADHWHLCRCPAHRHTGEVRQRWHLPSLQRHSGAATLQIFALSVSSPWMLAGCGTSFLIPRSHSGVLLEQQLRTTGARLLVAAGVLDICTDMGINHSWLWDLECSCGQLQYHWSRTRHPHSSAAHLAKPMTPAGLEPAIPGSVGRCLIHWATGPMNTCPPVNMQDHDPEPA